MRVRHGWAPLILGCIGLTTCTEYTYTTQTQTDIFQQVRRNTVDILLVVDNSGSMIEEQEKLASNFEAFISNFEGVDVDWQIAVITTDTVQADHRGRFRGGDDEIELLNAGGTSIDRVAWDSTWPIEEGASLQLDPSVTTASANDQVDAWCLGSSVYGETDRGTPGSQNPGCDARAPFPLDTGDTGDTGGTTAGDSAVLDDGDYEVYGLWYWPDSEYGVQGWESLELSLDSPHLTGGWQFLFFDDDLEYLCAYQLWIDATQADGRYDDISAQLGDVDLLLTFQGDVELDDDDCGVGSMDPFQVDWAFADLDASLVLLVDVWGFSDDDLSSALADLEAAGLVSTGLFLWRYWPDSGVLEPTGPLMLP